MRNAAVVVTYNRKALLTECLTAIIGQTVPPDTVIVIDNQSTDGTDQLFAKGAAFDLPIMDYRRMDANLGGAGGFYEGVKQAYRDGFDWIWIMDDDTIPTPTALEEMLKARETVGEDVSFFASAVYGAGGEPMNVPDLDYRRSPNGYPDWYYHADEGIIKIESATFVSLLINGKAVSKIGYPYKELFIWGDDKEYTLRMTHCCAPAYLVGRSRVIHKRAIAKRISIENETEPRRIDQFYYNYRNILVNVNAYEKGARSVIKRILGFNLLGLRILKDRNQQNRWRKIRVIHRGIWGFFLGTYDRSKFKRRFDLE